MSRDSIFAIDDLPREKVSVPEWGTDIWIRTLSGTERDDFEAASIIQRGAKRETNLRNLRARLVVLAACDESGKQIFEPGDVDRVGAKSGAVLDRLYTVASRLAGLTESDVADLAKN